MSYRHLEIAIELEDLKPGPKLVLLILANRACETCGIAWPGVRYVERKTGLGETAVRASLDALNQRHLIETHAYPTGGRGRATEYIVLPGLIEFSTAPCGECRKRMKTPRNLRGLTSPEPNTPRNPGGIDAKPLAFHPQNPSDSEPHSVIDTDSVSGGPRALRSEAATPPISDPTPTPAGDAVAQVEAMVKAAKAREAHRG